VAARMFAKCLQVAGFGDLQAFDRWGGNTQDRW
jgi:hypothetical protein